MKTKEEIIFIVGIFSACGKTNLSMLRPKGLDGYKIECVGKIEGLNFVKEKNIYDLSFR